MLLSFVLKGSLYLFVLVLYAIFMSMFNLLRSSIMKESLIVVLLAIGMVACTSEFENKLEQKNVDPTEDTAYSMASNLLETFRFSAIRSLDKMNSNVEYNYPNYYGGMFIKDGRLSIFVKGDVSENKGILMKGIGSSNVTFISCLYSYSELKGVLEHIYNGLVSNKKVLDNFVVAKLDDFNNRVVVGLKDCSQDKIMEFKNSIADFPSIVYELGIEGAKEESLEAGDLVYSYGTSGLIPATMGYRAKLMSQVGWVTAAHAFTLGDYVYNNSATKIGQCESSSYGWMIDAAFCVSTNSSYNPVSYDPTTSGEIVAGMSVRLRGGKTYTSGVITNSSTVCTTASGVILNDVAFGSYSSVGGDSGSSLISTDGRIIGIHHGYVNGGSDKVVIKESNIRSILGVSIY